MGGRAIGNTRALSVNRCRFSRLRLSGNHDGGAGAAEFGQIAICGHADVEPWAHPVEGAPLLADLCAIIGQHVIADPPTIRAAALWIVHTYCMDVLTVSPLAHISAPEMRCGKTVLLTAMMRLDHNRALSQVAGKLAVPVSDVHKITIWGNHSASQYPDLFHAEVGGRSVADQVDRKWLEDDFIPTVAKRGAAIIAARGASSAD